jgi:peptide deformylase
MKQKATKLEAVTEEIKLLINNMFDTLQTTDNGVGLAANQVGSSVALFVIDLSDVDGYREFGRLVFINPTIISYSEDKDFYNEGCLSVPNFYEDVERPIGITIKYQDIDMKEVTMEYSGFMARVIQHEYDHLQGILFTERMSSFKRTLSKNKLRKIHSGNYDIPYMMVEATGKMHE